MMRVEYRKNGLDYEIVRVGVIKAGRFFDEEESAGRTERVSIAYHVRSFQLLGHGPPDAVLAWATQKRKEHGGAPDLAVVTFPPDWPEDEINQALNQPGQLKSIIERLLADKPLLK